MLAVPIAVFDLCESQNIVELTPQFTFGSSDEWLSSTSCLIGGEAVAKDESYSLANEVWSRHWLLFAAQYQIQ